MIRFLVAQQQQQNDNFSTKNDVPTSNSFGFLVRVGDIFVEPCDAHVRALANFDIFGHISSMDGMDHEGMET